ncbi:Bgt-20185 [Blumeria graminis f. sp. tritici]|uniref:Bgt-20185 n=1 Tax=Blumeria graminis f. sp. tritici TaxID=62690 RepID=A0A9X9MJW3_BLUGR|nr:Bgt-20185 [Blumeria graminis f. sp. tritici]
MRKSQCKSQLSDNDTKMELNTHPIDWTQPLHALELNAILKKHEVKIEQVLPEHYRKFEDIFSKLKAEKLAPLSQSKHRHLSNLMVRGSLFSIYGEL